MEIDRWLLENLNDVHLSERGIIEGSLGGAKLELNITYRYKNRSLDIVLRVDSGDFEELPVYVELNHNVKTSEDLSQLVHLLGI